MTAERVQTVLACHLGATTVAARKDYAIAHDRGYRLRLWFVNGLSGAPVAVVDEVTRTIADTYDDDGLTVLAASAPMHVVSQNCPGHPGHDFVLAMPINLPVSLLMQGRSRCVDGIWVVPQAVTSRLVTSVAAHFTTWYGLDNGLATVGAASASFMDDWGHVKTGAVPQWFEKAKAQGDVSCLGSCPELRPERCPG